MTFEFDSGDGLRAKKVFRMDPESYVVTFSVEVSDGNATLNPAIEWGPGLGDSMHVEAQRSSFGTYVQKPQAILYANGSVERLAAERVPASPRGRATSRLPASTTTTSSPASSGRARCAWSIGPARRRCPGSPRFSAT